MKFAIRFYFATKSKSGLGYTTFFSNNEGMFKWKSKWIFFGNIAFGRIFFKLTLDFKVASFTLCSVRDRCIVLFLNWDSLVSAWIFSTVSLCSVTLSSKSFTLKATCICFWLVDLEQNYTTHFLSFYWKFWMPEKLLLGPQFFYYSR